MTVKELIAELQKHDPDAEVEVEGIDNYYITGVEYVVDASFTTQFTFADIFKPRPFVGKRIARVRLTDKAPAAVETNDQTVGE